MMMLDFETFNGLVGTDATVMSPEHGSVTVQVVEATETPGDRPDNAFSVLFKGPRETFLEQMSYDVTLGDAGTHLIFMVPVIEEPDGFVYEAVFTRLDT